MPAKKGSAKAAPTEAPSRAREAAARFAEAAKHARKEGKLAEARKLVEDALALVDDSPRLHIFYARILSELTLVDEARAAARAAFDWVHRKPERYHDYRAYLEKELSDHPQTKEAFFERGQEIERQKAGMAVDKAKGLIDQGDLAGALRALLDALASRAVDGPALAGIERILKETGNEKGLRYFESFRAGQLSRKDLITLVAPDEGETVEAVSELGLDVPREQTLGDLVAEIERELDGEAPSLTEPEPPEQFSQFRKRAEPVLKNDPKSRIDLAIGYFEMGLTEVAYEELRAVPESHAYYPRARCLLGEFLFRAEEPLKALPVLQECLRDTRLSRDEEKAVRYHLARTYQRLGDWPRAMVEIEALEKSDPTYRDLRFLKTEVSKELEGAGGTPVKKKGKQ